MEQVTCKWCKKPIEFVRQYGGEKAWIVLDYYTGEQHHCRTKQAKRSWLTIERASE